MISQSSWTEKSEGLKKQKKVKHKAYMNYTWN